MRDHYLRVLENLGHNPYYGLVQICNYSLERTLPVEGFDLAEEFSEHPINLIFSLLRDEANCKGQDVPDVLVHTRDEELGH